MSTEDRKIKISRQFIINGLPVWLGTDVSVPPDQDPIASFKSENNMLIQAIREIDPNDYSGVHGHPMSPSDPIETRRNIIIEDIKNCTAIDEKSLSGQQSGLLAYKDVSESDPIIKTEYDLKLFQLKK